MFVNSYRGKLCKNFSLVIFLRDATFFKMLQHFTAAKLSGRAVCFFLFLDIIVRILRAAREELISSGTEYMQIPVYPFRAKIAR